MTFSTDEKFWRGISPFSRALIIIGASFIDFGFRCSGLTSTSSSLEPVSNSEEEYDSED